jgi:hypothetical protein
MSLLQRLAIAYLTVVLLVATLAFTVDAALLHSNREHMVPDVMLMAVALPSSLSMEALFSAWPALFSLPFTQEIWAVLCGIFQAALLFVLGRRRGQRPDVA